MCALLKRNILGFRITKVNLLHDPLLFPVLKNTNDAEKELNKMRKALTNAVVTSVGRHGKYFWIRLNNHNTTNVLLMHFGMTGMIKLRNVHSHLAFMENGGDKKALEKLERFRYKDSRIKPDVEVKQEWPPRFTKFNMELENNDKKLEFAFSDPRRLARVRLLSGLEVSTDESLLKLSPLNALGPDYSKPEVPPKELEPFVFGDPDSDNHGRARLSIDEFSALILSKKKPIKSLLLDQTYFAGVGNWVADEVLFQAHIHPNEILSSKISKDLEYVHPVIQQLYDSLIYVCEEAVRVEGDVAKFPDDWLMLHRWGKGRKEKRKTPNGYILDHITVGGRTSCYCPELQRLIKVETATTTKRRKVKR